MVKIIDSKKEIIKLLLRELNMSFILNGIFFSFYFLKKKRDKRIKKRWKFWNLFPTSGLTNPRYPVFVRVPRDFTDQLQSICERRECPSRRTRFNFYTNPEPTNFFLFFIFIFFPLA